MKFTLKSSLLIKSDKIKEKKNSGACENENEIGIPENVQLLPNIKLNRYNYFKWKTTILHFNFR